MAKVRQKGTEAELALRRAMFRIGLRYRVDYEVLKKPRRVADIAFPSLRLAIFVDGCFWHGCPEHASWPKQNADFWREKIEANRLRDADTTTRLNELGWMVVRIWEHEDPVAAASNISATLNDRRARFSEPASSQNRVDRKEKNDSPDGNH